MSNTAYIALVILLLLLIGGLPVWPHSVGWGLYPTGGVTLALFILLLLVFTRRI